MSHPKRVAERNLLAQTAQEACCRTMTDEPKKTRLRFAPSPTGYLHIGGARTALFNWLYARHTGGTFLVRIEDTDLERSTPEVTQQIFESLKWLGMEPDEPVEFQTQRMAIYKRYLDQLLASGAAYKCYCPKERLEELREQAKREGRTAPYDKRCLRDQEWVAKQKAAGAPGVIRFNTPEDGVTAFDDMIYGHIEWDNKTIGDFVIARPDGSPIYNFCNAVDDDDMGITHICRGEEHIPNTPKQILLYRAMGKEPPRFAHLPLILGADKAKLSKRHGATSVMQFRDNGILPEALVNFIALLGWAPEGGNEEIMSRDDLVSRFTFEKVNKSGAVFDHEKLLWMNGVYIRNMPRKAVYGLVVPMLESRFGKPRTEMRNPRLSYEQWLEGVIDLAVERSRSLNEFGDVLDFFFVAPQSYEEKGTRKHLSTPEHMELLKAVGDTLETAWKAGDPMASENEVRQETLAELEEALRVFAEKREIKFGAIAQPLRLALTGRTASPGLFEILWFMGKQESLKRIGAALQVLPQKQAE